MVTDFFFFSEQKLLSLVLKPLVKCLLTAGPYAAWSSFAYVAATDTSDYRLGIYCSFISIKTSPKWALVFVISPAVGQNENTNLILWHACCTQIQQAPRCGAVQVGMVVVYSLGEKQIVDTRQRNNKLKREKKTTCPSQTTGKIMYFPLEMKIYFTDGSLTANRTVTFIYH